MEDQSICLQLSLPESVWEIVVVALGVESEMETKGVPNGRLQQVFTVECSEKKLMKLFDEKSRAAPIPKRTSIQFETSHQIH